MKMKKAYICPTVKMYCLKTRAHLLSGSDPEPTKMQINSDYSIENSDEIQAAVFAYDRISRLHSQKLRQWNKIGATWKTEHFAEYIAIK